MFKNQLTKNKMAHIVVVPMAFLFSCSKNMPPPEKKQRGVVAEQNEGSNVETEAIDQMSIHVTGDAEPVERIEPPILLPKKPQFEQKSAAFETTVYPLLRDNCAGSGCHDKTQAPLFAQQNVAAAYDAASDKIDFSDIKKSQLVVRLATLGHNCWSDCDDDAAEMTKAIQNFEQKLKEIGEKTKMELAQTDQLSFAAAAAAPGEVVDGTYVLFAKDAQPLTAPMRVESQNSEKDTAGNIKDYIEVTAANAGQASYTFNVTQAGTYALWIRVKNPENIPQQTINVSIDNSPPQVWLIENTAPGNWSWDKANNVVNNALTPIRLNLTAGNHAVILTGGTANLKFNRIALTTTQDNFEGGEVVGMANVLRFSAKSLCGGKDVTFKVEVSEFDAKAKMLSIRNLRVETTSKVHIKGIEALINGNYNPLNTTFRLVDETFNPPGKLAVRSALLAVGTDGFGKDKLSFSVAKCE